MSERARICLITPGHLSTNPRLIKEADALSGAGYDVVVLAATYQPWGREADKEFSGRPWRAAPPRAFGPRAPTMRRAFQLARHRFARSLMRGGARSPAVVGAAFHQVTPDLVASARAIAADLYVAHYPAALPAAAMAARRHSALYAYDAEDFHQGEIPEGAGRELERRAIASIEGAHLPRCAYVTAASPGIAEAYAQTYAIATPTVVLNVFPIREAPDSPSARGSATPGPSVYWFSHTIGPNRGLETAVRAVGRADSRPHLYLRGTPAAGFQERLQALALDVGAGDRLHLLSPGPPGDMVGMAAEFDVGLVGETGYTRNSDILLSNKQFTYLLAGIPVLMSNTLAHRRFADGLGAGLSLYPAEDAAALSRAMDQLLGDPARLREERSAAFRLGRDRFNWDAEKQVVLKHVEQALNSRGGPG